MEGMKWQRMKPDRKLANKPMKLMVAFGAHSLLALR